MSYFGGGGGASTTFSQYTIALAKAGPASYTTGGIDIDLSATFSTIHSASAFIKKGTRGNAGIGSIEVIENSPSAGHVTIKIIKNQYTRVGSFDTITSSSQPTGVTIQTLSGQTSSSEASHTHPIDHDHGSFTIPTGPAGGTTILLDATGPSGIQTHTHTLDLPNLTGTSGAGTAHNHTDNTLYDHTHALTYTDTAMSVAEIANATNLSATTFFIRATGVRA